VPGGQQIAQGNGIGIGIGKGNGYGYRYRDGDGNGIGHRDGNRCGMAMASLISFAITCSGSASQALRDLRHSLVASRSLYLISLRVPAMPTEFDP